jgi:multicomponent Na+:H+ antiporter subunit D
MSEAVHPAIPCLVGALLVPLVPARWRAAVAVPAAAAALLAAWWLPDGALLRTQSLGLDLVWLRADALGRVFAIIFALIALLGVAYALATPRARLLSAALVSTAAGEGIVLAGDWVTLYTAWELLAVASWVVIMDGGTARARGAGLRYLLVHLAGGAVLLAGIVWHRATGGSLLVEPLSLAGAGALVLVGFGVNAAIPPLHAWLTDAYPESSPAGTVFLSAFATKAAVYALARVFPGADILVVAGCAMALYGVLFAILENDIRRLLGYHIVSQVGYMVAGVGLGTPLAVSGAVAHAFCHILYKGLLMMGAGAVVHATGRRRLTDLGGLASAMPATVVLYMVGAFSISGAPLLNGFVSKSMVVAAAETEHREVVAWILLLASVGTFLSVGLKLPYLAFGGSPSAAPPATPVPRPMLAGMAATAALCALTGVAPGLLYALLPHEVTWAPYTLAHVMEALQILVGTALAFVLLRDRLAGKAAVSLDFDRAYRAIGGWVTGRLAPAVARGADAMEQRAMALAGARVALPSVPIGRPVGYAVLTAVVALGAGLGLYTVLR